MATELWWRNPSQYMRELVENNEFHYIFDEGFCVKRNFDPHKWIAAQLGEGMPYRMLYLRGGKGVAEYTNESPDIPVAVYPIWEYEDDQELLEEMMMVNCGDEEIDFSLSQNERPVAGQEHRVVIQNYPDLKTSPGMKFVSFLRLLQEKYPDTILHLHGCASFSIPYRMEFRATDWEPRIAAVGKVVVLPNGARVNTTHQIEKHRQWITLLGMKPVDLEDTRARTIYNVRSARWGSQHFTKELRVDFNARRANSRQEWKTPDSEYDPATNSRFYKAGVDPQPGDKYVCNSCTLAVDCKLYREGSVCSLPKSEPKSLSAMFRTRDANSIIEGLGEVLAINVERAEQGREEERDFGLSSDVTAILRDISSGGEKLAKLLDPALRSPQLALQINQGGIPGQLPMGNSRQFIARIFKDFELQGVKREDVTQQMIEDALRAMVPGNAPRAIEGEPVVITDL